MRSKRSKNNYLKNEHGFALITAMMMLFAATILGLMVMNSSEIEILLSGAQQRYENNLNVAEGAVSVEAAAVGTGAIINEGNTYERTYAVSDPGAHDQVLSPDSSLNGDFDPYGHMAADAVDYTVTTSTQPNLWPMDNLLQPGNIADAEERFAYHYRTLYQYATAPPKGYDATKFSGYMFQISAQRTTLIELGGSKVGPKVNL